LLCSPETADLPRLDEFWKLEACHYTPSDFRALLKLCVTRVRHYKLSSSKRCDTAADAEFARRAAIAAEEATVSDELVISLASEELGEIHDHWIALVADKLSRWVSCSCLYNPDDAGLIYRAIQSWICPPR
jgi:hypothetical protein